MIKAVLGLFRARATARRKEKVKDAYRVACSTALPYVKAGCVQELFDQCNLGFYAKDTYNDYIEEFTAQICIDAVKQKQIISDALYFLGNDIALLERDFTLYLYSRVIELEGEKEGVNLMRLHHLKPNDAGIDFSTFYTNTFQLLCIQRVFAALKVEQENKEGNNPFI